jgi:hypothetical protein
MQMTTDFNMCYEILVQFVLFFACVDEACYNAAASGCKR